jgi:hypothetical protein
MTGKTGWLCAKTTFNFMTGEGKHGQAPGAVEAGEKTIAGGPVKLPTVMTFEQLIKTEFTRLNPKDPPAPYSPDKPDENFAQPGPADEPWVVFTKYDHFGIALSGGGIRSATFNLGLLQGLHRRGVLEYVDYLSTVSGGGYTGGFWTAWRKHHHPADGTIFPASGPENPTDKREGPEIRHLREFSRFLMPRIGFSCAETWSAIATILSGLLPSLLMTLALTCFLVYAWLGVNYILIKDLPAGCRGLFGWLGCFPPDNYLARHGYFAGLFGFAAITMAIHLWCEYAWRKSGKAGNAACGWLEYGVCLTGTVLASGIGWWLWRNDWLKPGVAHDLSSLLFGPAVGWALAALLLMLLRLLGSGFSTPKAAIGYMNLMDRCIYRCLAPAVLCGLAASMWMLSGFLMVEYASRVQGGGGFALTALFGALFAWLRGWLAEPVADTNQSQLLHRIAAKVKPWIPQLLAGASVVVFVLSVMVKIRDGAPIDQATTWAGLFVALSVVVLLLLLFDPARVGLHNFYRERIARCFLGAARQPGGAAWNRQTSEQKGDDLTLGSLREFLEVGGKTPNRPIHLVCCAANNLSGDALATLYRGARSAVLSPHGISLGNHNKLLDELDFSAALTASAAAFNSQMGRLSMQLGPAVAIVMSALNLRLGLWVPHPLKPEPEPEPGSPPEKWRRRYLFPGWLFLCEMFGLTKCDAVPPEMVTKLEADSEMLKREDLPSKLKEPMVRLQALMRNVHLSDGGHFENLGLYELIRRHCRYVIVSDCGADPEVAFDDLANALRRVREDFGVEIDLDVEPLRPGPDKRSAQHAVVGTIHYDGLAGTDKGTILYFKPSLTGDEPPDTIQYQTRNPAFPHESTMNQFYDEAQWEAYRRLGEHQASMVLTFTPKGRRRNISFVENFFLEASQRWHPAPAGQAENFLELTERCSDLEKDVRDTAPAVLRFEFFPEVEAAGLARRAEPAGDAGTAGGKAANDEEIKVVYFLMIAVQIMEDTWLGAELDVYWSHPLNEGWMHYFQRWASMPSFRRWWPVLRPLYSSGFGEFVKERFDLRLVDVGAGDDWKGPATQLNLRTKVTPAEAARGLAWQRWAERFGEPRYDGKAVLDYQLKLDTKGAAGPVQVGFLLFTQNNGGTVAWRTSELFVPHSLIGGGIIARFLDAVLSHFVKETTVAEIRITLEDEGAAPRTDQTTPLRPDLASRQQRVHTINFYKSRFFVYQPPAGHGKIHELVFNVNQARAKRAGGA